MRFGGRQTSPARGILREGTEPRLPNGNEVCGIDIVHVSSDYTGSLQCADGEAKNMGFYPINQLPQPISSMNAIQLQAYLKYRKERD